MMAKPAQLWPIFALWLAALLLWQAAYQAPFHQTLHVGGDLERQRRYDEDPFFAGINGAEPPGIFLDPSLPECQQDPPPAGVRCRIWWTEWAERTGLPPYRWTRAATTFLVPGAGPGRYLLELRAGGAPGGTSVEWTSSAGPVYHLTIPEGDPRRYRILAHADAAGDLRLMLQAIPFAAPNDPRELGFVLYGLRSHALDGGWHAPAWPQLGWLSISLVALYVGALAAGSGVRGAVGVAALAIFASAYTLAFQRPVITLFTPLVALLSCLGATTTLVAAVAQQRWPRTNGIAAITALVMLAWALRVAGMLHPHAIYSDSAMQANKLFEASLGNVFLTAGLPSAAGGGLAPYPPAMFLALMPLQLLAPTGHHERIVLVQGATALLDSLVVALLWLVLRRCGLGSRAALFGAAGYLLPLTALESFSIGELANVGGQTLAMPFLALLALGYASPKAPGAWPMVLLSATLSLALVAHSGVTLSLGALVGSLWAIGLAAIFLRRPSSISITRLSLVVTLSLSFALICYYSAPVYIERVFAGERSSVGGRPLGSIMRETSLGILGFIPPGARARPIPTLLSLSALAGLALLWAGRAYAPRTASLRMVLVAWWLATLLTQGLLLVANQGVRWGLFLYPGLCLSAGPLWAALWRRGSSGRIVVALILAALLSFGLAHWIAQVRDYLHG
ncbi:MAG: hypothetical protein EI684_06830 [Candidatus Viridilinea halotolerans]|uniref:Uncharacterized protein n=1 Tax=Candidatus Viridilinea halotolerans TaxID=2491704 RepID=A0A426U3T7_9CHLR|nr:MAG: hypothetical protein EI684_06830 [Candidatus Viridilinea halotolerans]